MAATEPAKRGLLKIFLGMAPGVGKTYAMLAEAHQLKALGRDVVIGSIVSHGDREIEALAAGIEIIPAESLTTRKPLLVLVDELTSPGHYRQILELMDANIDVYTTVNIQHIESIADQIGELCGLEIRERIPDSFFDKADYFRMVDAVPEELLLRLEAGKVAVGGMSKELAARFFALENLAILRELALRYVSQLASRRLDILLRSRSRHPAIPEKQCILAAIGPSPNSEHLIRRTRGFADKLKADWTCLYVDTGLILSESGKEQLTANITLARNLGANVMILPGNDIVEAVVDYAEQHKVSLLLIGKSGKRKNRRLALHFIRAAGKIPVLSVQDKSPADKFTGWRKKGLAVPGPLQYGIAFLVIACITGINLVLRTFTGYWSTAIMYLAAISFLAFVVERIPLLLAAAISALLWNFLFIPPVITFSIHKTEDVFGFFFYFILAITSSWMTSRLKRNEKIFRIREQRMRLINELSESLEKANGVAKAVLAGSKYITGAFDCKVVVYLKEEENNALSPAAVNQPGKADANDWAAAGACFSRGIATGCFTGTLPTASHHYVPMAAPGGTIGVIGVRPADKKGWTDDQESFLLTLASTLSLAVQREILYERNRKNMLIKESERLGRVLLNSVTHEIKTPLAIIQGCASELLDYETADDKAARDELIMQILLGSRRLNNITENLLSMNRLESGSLQLRIKESDPGDIISLSIKQVHADISGRKVNIKMPEALPSLPCDILLIIQVMINLLRNAVQYSGAGTPIGISVEVSGGMLCFRIEDSGPGVAEDELPHIFGKFFRGRAVKKEGMGLGLSICKGIIEAHGGSISAQNRQTGGFSVAFTLPLEQGKV